ncbi:MAG TPA: hypothetical protein VGE88_10065, partial [Lysobacter sp.]
DRLRGDCRRGESGKNDGDGGKVLAKHWGVSCGVKNNSPSTTKGGWIMPLSHRERGWGEGQRSRSGEPCSSHSATLLLGLPVPAAEDQNGFQLSLE